MKTSTLTALLAALLTLSLTACGAGTVDGGTDDAAGDNYDALSTKGRFEIFQGQDGKSYFHLLAANGEKVLASQGYASATSAKNGIATVKTNGAIAARYQLRTASDGSPYFVLKAGNGQIIGVSELFATAEAANKAINTVIEIVQATASDPLPIVTGARFEIFQGMDGKYYFNLHAANGEIVLQSQGYASKSSATSGTGSVETNAVVSSRFEVRAAADGNSYFVLKAGNGHVIGVSEMYTTGSNAQRGEQGVVNAVNAILPAK